MIKNVGALDYRIGKVRIRLSTLEFDRVYTHSYPPLMLHPTGVKKMGELHLAVRFSCASIGNMLHMYTMPMLPKMHYVHPLSVNQLESLRYQAMNVVSSHLNRAEPPLGREVVKSRPRNPPHMDTRLSQAESVYPDEFDEEFDSFPTNRSVDIVRIRYDQLRSMAGRIQTVVGDMAS
ncbi:hypothetical protein LWI28_025534 [Acer negundo]|uniref:Multiple C2 domain-containing protein n=1 Tax=Acer negundo TaxID=4023 RepID=A0AAD5NW77_ACENE|nr:hypothetical protein LWI28_025534 [Acer negundo]